VRDGRERAHDRAQRDDAREGGACGDGEADGAERAKARGRGCGEVDGHVLPIGRRGALLKLRRRAVRAVERDEQVAMRAFEARVAIRPALDHVTAEVLVAVRALDLEGLLRVRRLCHLVSVPVPSGPRRSLAAVSEDWARRGVAEFVGAFTLVFAGVGAIALGGDLTAVALAHGLAIAVMASAVGHISGGHFNPAVTFGFWITRRIETAGAVVYWVSQLLGAVVAALLARWLFPGDPLGEGVPSVHVVSAFDAMVLELILTVFLVWVIFATAADERGTFKSIAGLAIGFTITMDIFAGGRLTGAAMNPARAFGPQLVGDHWADGWVWYVGPLLGGAVAALAYEWLYLRPLRPLPVGPPESGVLEPRPGEAAES
jgi:aquaporin TIP